MNADATPSHKDAHHPPKHSSGGSSSAPANKAIAQYTADAQLHAAFEQSAHSGNFFDYSNSLRATVNNSDPQPSFSSPTDADISAYLAKIQRGGHVQPFGCIVAVHSSSYRIIAFSDNTAHLLGLPSHPPTPLIGLDVRSLFSLSTSRSLERAFTASEIALSNPVWICSAYSGKSFYGILHRIDVGIVLDLEPALCENPASSMVGAVQSQKLAVRAVSKLQALPCGDLKLLCDTVVECVRELVAYDRVMVYKFHEDEHGEVVAENRREDLESYLGLHYPATDIPQAARFMFKQSRVRMIVDCNATPVRVVQDHSLARPLCLVGSTLRAPHGCHATYMANMGSVASLAMAVIINQDNSNKNSNNNSSMRLWGLVVCHHTSARCIPFPLRYACEFFMQAFGIQLKMELQLAAQLVDKNVLRTQTLLCDMILRDSPTGIVTQSPNIMDIVKCDGAALYYRGRYYPVGVTPDEAQIKEIMRWLETTNGDSTGLATDSLADANFNGASVLGDAVCGMAVACISANEYLFWFRSHSAKEVKWGGAKHHPGDTDDGARMHPRTSFKAFLEVVKSRSLPWETAEIRTIHSLQLILRNSFVNTKRNPVPRKDVKTRGVDEVSSVMKEMARLMETASAPVFAVDANGCVNGWNGKVASLTGLPEEEAIGRLFVKEVVVEECKKTAEKLICNALRGEEERNVELKLKAFRSGEAVYVVVNACSSKDFLDNIVGVCFVGQDVTGQKVATDNFIKIQDDYRAIIHSPTHLIPPIFAADHDTFCVEWNAAMEKLTKVSREEALGKTMAGELFGNLCSFLGPDSLTKFMIVLHAAIRGQETDQFPFSFYGRTGNLTDTDLTAKKRVDSEGKTIGAFFFLHVRSEVEHQQAEKRSLTKMELSYICQQIRNPLNGVSFSNSLLNGTDLSDDKKQLLVKGASFEKQLFKILDNICIETTESVELDNTEFLLGTAVDAIVTHVTLPIKQRNLRLIHNVSEETKNTLVAGDEARVEQVVSEYLLNIVRHSYISHDWVEMHVNATLKQPGLVQTEFRVVWPGEGLPPEVVRDMLSGDQADIGLAICRKLLEVMTGEVRYIIESGRCCFSILLVHPLVKYGNGVV